MFVDISGAFNVKAKNCSRLNKTCPENFSFKINLKSERKN